MPDGADNRNADGPLWAVEAQPARSTPTTLRSTGSGTADPSIGVGLPTCRRLWVAAEMRRSGCTIRTPRWPCRIAGTSAVAEASCLRGASNNRESVGCASDRGSTSAVYSRDCGNRRPEVAKTRSTEDVLCSWSLLSCAYHRRGCDCGLRKVDGSGDDCRRLPQLADTNCSRGRARPTEKERRTQRVVPVRQMSHHSPRPYITVRQAAASISEPRIFRRSDIPGRRNDPIGTCSTPDLRLPGPCRWFVMGSAGGTVGAPSTRRGIR